MEEVVDTGFTDGEAIAVQERNELKDCVGERHAGWIDQVSAWDCLDRVRLTDIFPTIHPLPRSVSMLANKLVSIMWPSMKSGR